MEVGRMIISALCLPKAPEKKPVIMQLSADPSLFLFRCVRQSGETLGMAAAELIGEEKERKKRIRTSFNRLCQAEQLHSQHHLSLAAQDFLFLC
jgi:hypothetical protein